MWQNIRNAELVIKHFGSWISFHDCEITKIELQRNDVTLLLQLQAYKLSKDVDAKGYLKQEHPCLITFRFTGIDRLEIQDFNEQNVLFELTFDKIDEKIQVTLHPSYGVRGIFLCQNAEVLSLEPVQVK